MAFVKYSKAKLDLVGEDVPEWVDDKDKKQQKVEASVEDLEEKDTQKDD